MTRDFYSLGAFLALGSSAIIAICLIVALILNPSLEKDKLQLIGYIAISLSGAGAGALQVNNKGE